MKHALRKSKKSVATKTTTTASAKKSSTKTPTTKQITLSKSSRPSWDEYFMSLAETVGNRGTCDRGKSGCVIVKDKRILTTGYVGSPIGLPHCDEVGHEMHKVTHSDGSETMHCIRTVHAEQNALIQATRTGIALQGGTVYCKMTPCYVCAKLIINSGIVRVVASKDYHASAQSKRAFKEADVELEILDKTVEQYANMK